MPLPPPPYFNYLATFALFSNKKGHHQSNQNTNQLTDDRKTGREKSWKMFYSGFFLHFRVRARGNEFVRPFIESVLKAQDWKLLFGGPHKRSQLKATGKLCVL